MYTYVCMCVHIYISFFHVSFRLVSLWGESEEEEKEIQELCAADIIIVGAFPWKENNARYFLYRPLVHSFMSPKKNGIRVIFHSYIIISFVLLIDLFYFLYTSIECALADYVSGIQSEKVPFVFLPAQGQLINPNAEIALSGKQPESLFYSPL